MAPGSGFTIVHFRISNENSHITVNEGILINLLKLEKKWNNFIAIVAITGERLDFILVQIFLVKKKFFLVM